LTLQEFTWNVADHFSTKAMGGANCLESVGAKGITTQIEGVFSMGWTFQLAASCT